MFRTFANPKAEKPHLFYLISFAFIQIAGLRYTTYAMTNSLFLIFLIIATYTIGKHLKDRETGLMAAAILSLYPPIYLYSRSYNLILPTTTMVTCSILALIESDFFSKRYNSIICGIILGLGLLTKQSVLVFISGPLIYLAYITIRGQKKNNLNNLIICFAFTLLIALIYYYPLEYRIKDLIKLSTLKDNQPIFFYISTLGNLSLSYYSISLIALGLYYLLKKKQKERHILFSWIILSMIILSIATTKRDRYIIPIMPALAIISAYGVTELKWRKLKILIWIITLYFGLLYFFKFSFFVNSKLMKPDNISKYFIPKHTRYGNPIRLLKFNGLLLHLNNSNRNFVKIALIEEDGYSQWLRIFLTERGFRNVMFFEDHQEALEADNDFIIFSSKESALDKTGIIGYELLYSKQIIFDCRFDPILKISIFLFKKTPWNKNDNI
ncbi:MAG: glycosyltransferase family 39 protein [Candidatus Kaelpia imicola]|nr:glycosyltransferase family 39 protein [Candidatus Kaelpia imicola]